jgi:hypothetical protein
MFVKHRLGSKVIPARRCPTREQVGDLTQRRVAFLRQALQQLQRAHRVDCHHAAVAPAADEPAFGRAADG